MAKTRVGSSTAGRTGGMEAEVQGNGDGLDALARGVQQPSGDAAMCNALSQDPQLIQEFLVEAREHLSTIEGRMLEIEHGTASGETLNSAFRSFHTIKGLAGFLDFTVMQEVAHEVETLLDLARKGELDLDPARIDVILRAGDYLGCWLRHIEGVEQRAPEPAGPLIAQVTEAARAREAPVEGAQPGTEPEASVPADPGPAAPAGPERADTAVARPENSRNEAALVKVATGKLEYLVDMVGELVIAQSLLRHNQDLAGLKIPRLQRDLAQLSRVTGEVQKTAMAMRMVQVGQLFRKMTRLVRDLARKSGKRAELDLAGEDVEIDRTIVDELADPLVHMIRNSMDHGVEHPEQRLAAGKPEAGRLRLKAEHKAGLIVIELSDDGRGLDRERILARAVERGIVKPGEKLTDSEVFQLIFEAGFSTAEKVTDVSGRGVGMDVVRKHLEKLRGRVEIDSVAGAGTTFTMKLPLTLAIIDGLVVEVAGERLIMPIFAVREMFKAAAEMLFTLEGRREMVLVRERLLPLVRLGDRLGFGGRAAEPCEGLMIVGESEGHEFCLLVDALVGKQEVVIKSLGRSFEHVKGVAGGAILGDGRVGLILDIAGLVRLDCASAEA